VSKRIVTNREMDPHFAESALLRLDLNVIDALVALLDERNLTNAAAAIGTSQPAMSATLTKLRQYFGDELLVRIGRDFRPTSFARQLLPAARAASVLIRGVLRLDAAFDPLTDDRVFRVAASDYAVAVLHGPLTGLLRARRCTVTVEFVDMFAGLTEGTEALLNCDAVVSPLGMGVYGNHILLYRDRIVGFVDRDNRFLRDGTVDAASYPLMPTIGIRFPGSSTTVVDRWIDDRGPDRRPSVEVLGGLGSLYAVSGSDAVALVPERVARRAARTGQFVVIHPPYPLLDMHEALHWHPVRDLDPAHAWLRSTLVAAAAAVQDEFAPSL
jgi:DNA-binding transcriptional LysR family regulator